MISRYLSTCIKMERKLKHASHTTIFSSLCHVISGFTSGHGSSPGNLRKITRKFAPICGAAIPRPYPVVFLQYACVSAKSSTSARISAVDGSLTLCATSRNPGSPNCKTVRIAILVFLSLRALCLCVKLSAVFSFRSSPCLLRSPRTLCKSFLRFFPPPGLPRPKHRLNHRHVRNRVLKRHRNFAILPNCLRELVALHGILVASGNHFRSDPAAEDVSPIVDEKFTGTVVWCVERNFDFDAALGAEELHPLVRHQLRAARKHCLARRKFQYRRRQPVRLEIRVP